MANEERPSLTLVSDNKTPAVSLAEQEESVENLVGEYSCAIDEKPEWCVWGNDNGVMKVLAWIRPSQGDKFMARKIAQLLSRANVSATAEMTEWNPNQHDTPIYAQTVEGESQTS